MPHCIVEYSVELEDVLTPAMLMEAVHDGALGSGLFDGPDIKTRLVAYTHYQVGNEKKPFVHVSAKILSGRSSEQKQVLAQSILDKMRVLALANISLTVEVLDMDRSSYAKCVN
ncbi:5-carboxymethyl-2-hydroxymuconate Delta-isomerase [Pontibacterium sp. N1Y112]|uniref:5-carboxymethyl-2-hydroxymuconate Delta-isomerase n=1 Tax=Pontibacterium sinense TaxID=2781979 RepID=A0A8J7FK05_9GAMM|nr:5-carboxymethyl-2-hydroxymuconate Delta-isomerase [Pontibacterium sinense]MBE9397618.1 5-carboxymethyl-2-hydroxymuconate Delta-isomerase [Pontibacterium sinense]